METLITRQFYDVAGRLIEQWDPRLFEHAPKPNLATVHGLSGHPVKVDSVDSGWRLSLAGLGGEILQRWDERGNRWQTTYDDLLRALTVDENTQQVEVFTYARGDADPGYNLRGQLRKKVDPAGSIEFSRFSLQSMPFEETRTFPEGKVYTTAWSYIASGQPVSQTDASGHQQRSRYDITGQLKHVTLQIKADDTVLDILKDAQYNADGQLVEQLAGNDVLSTWTYDPADGRLQSLKTGVPGQAPRQHLGYVYDRVGNVQRIDDHTFQPVFFANQRIDGHREFTHDSLYRVISATGHDATPPSDLPGRPLPSDPRNHLNYTQRYEYDTGGNLIKLIHGRAVGGYTRQLFIDPESNRGVRWKEGDPAPDFSALFDRHGNLQALHPGQDLRWNNRDQLASVTLVERDDAANDEETYRYSHGARVYKRHDTHATSTSHFHEVIYLPGLEIRTRDNGEELHVITVPGGRSSGRCLHWVSGRPGEIEADQLRYSLDDHLGSSVIELDQQARLISHEGYYPFGGTAWLTADSAVEVSYKTVRYSGKEMDVSGLYYYGLRYYAPWLQRWVSADPAGDVDGLNLYAFVGNNPLNYVDGNGGQREKQDIYNYALFISTLATVAAPTLEQIENVVGGSNIAKNMLKNTIGESMGATAAFFGGLYGGKAFEEILLKVDINIDSFADGFIGGNVGSDLAAEPEMKIRKPFKLVRPLIPQTSTMSVNEIDRKAGLDISSDSGDVLEQGMLMFLGRFVGAVVPGVSALVSLGTRAQEAEDIKNGLTPVKIDKIETMLSDWKTATQQRWAVAEASFSKLGADVIYPADVLPNVNNMTPKNVLAPIHRVRLEKQTKLTLAIIDHTQYRMHAYKISRTTDNQFTERQRRLKK
ncbi:RHS repeat domain-containing protein [Pseudomonas sp. ANT_H12B]|uniref:RHS repeat domain-containing protein n=1 Tax=Pseudomonas sp. ANT_H12B TaxID=2597348 RepID=UPI002116DA19|nr:RHS repeat-associated core domain-containing protein [Pseudomonas sp. ANT_H12B]